MVIRVEKHLCGKSDYYSKSIKFIIIQKLLFTNLVSELRQCLSQQRNGVVEDSTFNEDCTVDS